MSCAMSPSCYRSLSPDSIRLVRLLPHEDENAPIRCELFDYSLRDSGKRMHLYEALSYVWGDSDNPQSIYIGEHNLPVTKNLHAALSRLRNFSLERILWIDAICIDQKNTEEKEQQIQLMAMIYNQANRVLVWLGEAADNSDQALEEIRAAGGKATNYLNSKTIQSAVLALLQRDWFQRIWVLQEVAAARHVLIMCGYTEIDGYAFCLGIDSFNKLYEARAELQSLIRSVTYLIRGAIFRPTYMLSRRGRFPQAIGTLGELMDMYHNHKATLLHDKVYALIGMSGMSSDDLSKAKLLPNYQGEWEELLQRLVKFLLCEKISVETWSGEITVIKSKGCILGSISSVQMIIASDGTQGVDVSFRKMSEQRKGWKYQSTHWTLKPPAKPIRKGDIICLLKGASIPTIIRLRKDHFVIIMIAASPLETRRTELDYIECLKLFPRDFLLVWDWGNSPELQDLGEYNALIRTNDRVSEDLNTEVRGHLNKASRIWNLAMVLEDIEEPYKADGMLAEIIPGYKPDYRSRPGRTPLLWAAQKGYDTVVNILLKEDNMNLNLKDSKFGLPPLSWAAMLGHEAIVKLLLETGRVDVDLKNRDSQTPLSWAARNGHKAIVKLLLETGRVDVDSKDTDGQTPLSYAAENRHEGIVKLLRKHGGIRCAGGKVIKAQISSGRTIDLSKEPKE